MVADYPWRRSLGILWIVNFVSSAGMSMVVPFLSIYVVQLGVKNQSAAVLWSGMIFGANHLFISLSAPFWGKLADKYGPKAVMLPTGFGMAIVYAAMAYATSPFHLLLLRCVFGTVNGFGAASVALQAIVTPRDRAGEALGRLQSGSVAGGLIGPLLGGLLAEAAGVQHTFLLTAGSLFISTLMVLTWVRSTGKPTPTLTSSQSPNFMHVIRTTPLLLALYFSSFLVAAGIQTIEPVLTLFVKTTMGIQHHADTISGLIFSTSALGTVLAAPVLGKLGDKYGSHRILTACLIFSTLCYLPQAFIVHPVSFACLRFLSGLSIGGLIPSINALLRRITSIENQGMTFGLNQTALSLGNVGGPLLGGVMDARFGMSSIFFATATLFAINFAWIILVSRRPMPESSEAL